jgi:colicin import membrane protein
LQLHSNNGIRRIHSERARGIAGTAVLHLILFAILILVGFSAPVTPETEKGILVNFGTDETGLGMIEPSPPSSTIEASSVQPATAASTDKEDAVVTQNIEKEAPVVKKVDPEAETKRKAKIEADRIRRAEAEAENIKKIQAEAERKKIEAEQKRVSDIVNRTKNALANSKNAGTTSTSEGIAGGSGNQGDPNGSVDSKIRGKNTGTGTSGTGVSFDLGGRGFKNLPNPRYEYQGEGKVVVEVSVDRSGKVTEATAGAKGSTTLDEYLLSVAREAAMRATFDPKPDAPLKQKGTITYNFVLK